MACWTHEHSLILCQLLDDVVGTQETVDIRQDFCRMHDYISSKNRESVNVKLYKGNVYYTGSKAEGLDLPGSDKDFMLDRNDLLCIEVVQSLDERSNLSRYSIFLMSTENVPLGFALLQHVNPTLNNPMLLAASQNINGLRYLSSNLVMENY